MAQLQTTKCDAEGRWQGSGTGFLIDKDLLVTAAHVVKDASTITAVIDDELTGVQVLGSNDVADVALLRLTHASKGHVFRFDDTAPPLGTAVAALGFPLRQKLSFSQGTVSGLDREFTDGAARQGHLIQTDTAVNPGNSGGPLITIDGSVAGVVVSKLVDTETESVEGIGFAVEGPRAGTAVNEWQERAVPVDLKPCDTESPDPVTMTASISSEHDQAPNIAQSLQAHGQGINDSAYASAFNLFTPSFQRKNGGLDTWEGGLSSTVWLALDVLDVSGQGDDLKAKVEMVSSQSAADAPVKGQTCSVWKIEYDMHWDGLRWLIAGARRYDGPPVACEFGD